MTDPAASSPIPEPQAAQTLVTPPTITTAATAATATGTRLLALPALTHATAPTFDAAAQQLAADNGWGLLPTATNGIWNAGLTSAAQANGLHPMIDEVPITGMIHIPHTHVRATRSAAAERNYLKKGCRNRTNANQKPPGRAKVHYGRRTYQCANGPITLAHLQIQRRDGTTRNHDDIYLPAMSRPTDQVRHAEYMAHAMDKIPVNIQGHHFHHSTILAALDVHAASAHKLATDHMANHDGHQDGQHIGFTDP